MFHRTNGLVFFSCHVCQNHLRRRVSAGCWHTLNTSLIFSNFPLNQRNHRDGGVVVAGHLGLRQGWAGCRRFTAVEFQFGRIAEVLEMVVSGGCSAWQGPLS